MTTVLGHPSNSPTQHNVAANATTSPNPVMVKLQGVTKTYPNGSLGLFDLSLEVKRGDFLLITGPSGAGKSTLLKLLYGAERPSSGEVIVDDLNVGKLRGDRLSLLRRRIGVVFQDYKLIPTRTVSENIAFVLWAQGYTRKGNLDPDNSRQVLNILKKLNGMGATVIVTTHDEQLVQMSRQPVVQLREGRLYRGF